MKRLRKMLNKLLWPILNKFLWPIHNMFPWLIPYPRRIYLMHKVARKRFNQFMKQRLGHFMVEIDPGPVGPKELILKTAVLGEKSVQEKTNPDYYFMSGYIGMLSWMQILKRCSFNLRTASAIMELGCGSARLIRHLRCIDGIRLVGADVDPDNIAWCQLNVPGIEFNVNDLRPPLLFAEDNSFDLVFAASVFTHIPLETQHVWIEEMYRILRPGGFFLADVLGSYHQRQMLSREDMDRLKKNGQLVLDAGDDRASLSTQLIGSWDVFQTRQEVLRAFGSVFYVHDYLPGGLDLLVLQKLSLYGHEDSDKQEQWL